MPRKKQQKQLAVLATLVLIATALWFHFGQGAKSTSEFTSKGQYTPMAVPEEYGRDPFPPWQDAQKAECISSGRNIFAIGPIPARGEKKRSKDDHIRPIGPVEAIVEKPVLRMVFFGWGTLPVGRPRQAFLEGNSGEDGHIVSEGDLLLSHFRILHIGNEHLDFVDVNSGLNGSARLEVPPAV